MDGEPMNDDYSIATRASLLERLRGLDDQRSWQEFFDTYWRLIHGVARKAGLTEDEAQDVVQETVISVARHLPGFRYDPEKCAFKTWLLNVTRWKVADGLRRRRAGKFGGAPQLADADVVPSLEEIPAPAESEFERMWDAEWSARLLDIATQRLKSQVSPKQFQVFYLHVMKEIPVREVARRLGVSRGQVYLAKHRVGRTLRRELRLLQADTV